MVVTRDIENRIKRDMTEAISVFARFRRNYQLWFTLYADPLSDDIVSDIREQATRWAWERSSLGAEWKRDNENWRKLTR